MAWPDVPERLVIFTRNPFGALGNSPLASTEPTATPAGTGSRTKSYSHFGRVAEATVQADAFVAVQVVSPAPSEAVTTWVSERMIGSSPYGFGNFSVELGSASSARLPT
jgi:hypothetical protein